MGSNDVVFITVGAAVVDVAAVVVEMAVVVAGSTGTHGATTPEHAGSDEMLEKDTMPIGFLSRAY